MTPGRMKLETLVSEFLKLALVHPDKEPRTQRAARDNEMMIISYNRAQEDLRRILSAHGTTPAIRALGEVRHPKQRRTVNVGNLTVWEVG